MKLQIVFATETGTAQSFAEKLHFRVRKALPVSLFDITELHDQWQQNDIYVFIVSTTGEGEVPLAMKPFWNSLLKSSLSKTHLSACQFAVFGLGDSGYEKFNAAARKLRARILQLGAREICKSGAGDDQTDSELSFDRWTEETLLPALKPMFPSITDEQLKNMELDPPKFTIAFGDSTKALAETFHANCTQFTVTENKRLTSAEWHQDIRHLELDSPVQYHTGDVFYMYPTVDKDIALKVLGSKFPEIDPEATLTCTPSHPFLPHTLSITVIDALTRYLDLLAMPNRAFFFQLSFFATDEEERDRLLEFADSTRENASQYISYCKRERRTIAEALLDFPSLQLPFERLIEFMPRIKPRAYSIASSPQVTTRIQLTIALLQYLTPNKRMKHGTCSAFVSRLKPGDKLFGYITPGALSLPEDSNTPLVLVATGTGCAPMRSLIQGDTLDRQSCRFYLGCRSAKHDMLYEWKPEIKLCLALSKDNGCRVTQLLARDGEILYELLVKHKGYFFVSGSAKQMPADVRETLVQAFGRHGNMSREEAVKLLRVMERERRYVVDAWS